MISQASEVFSEINPAIQAEQSHQIASPFQRDQSSFRFEFQLVKESPSLKAKSVSSPGKRVTSCKVARFSNSKGSTCK